MSQPYIEDPQTMCWNAANRLAAVETLLGAILDNDTRDDGGFTLSTALDLIGGVRADLRRSVAQAEKQQAGAR